MNSLEVATAGRHLLAAKYFQLAAFVMLIYEYCLTFHLEVERIWQRKFHGATILFLLNRYATPIFFGFILAAFHDPSWSKELCERVVRFEGYGTVALVAVCEIVMILRIFALYFRNPYVLGALILLLCVQVTISCIGLSIGFPVPLPPGFVGCILTGPPSTLLPAVWYTPLVTDSVIFALMVYRVRTGFRSSRATTPTVNLFVKDGILYYLVIFVANAVNVLIYSFAMADLKAIGASFSHLITSVMISRLLLNLRGVEDAGNPNSELVVTQRIQFASEESAVIFTTIYEQFWDVTVDNLGADLDPALNTRQTAAVWSGSSAFEMRHIDARP